MQTSDKPVDQSLRLVFAGTPEFSAIHLSSLLRHYQVSAVYTQPDRPAGRGKKLTASPVKQLAEQHNIPVYQPETLKSAESQHTFANLKPDLFIVVAYGLILPQAILDIPRNGCINVHASLLPRWRGAAPIQRALEAGDSETGVTIMQMDQGLDTGDMLLKAKCTIEATDTAATLHDKIADLGTQALNEVVNQIQQGECQPTKQDDTQATYAEKISKQEAVIDWHSRADIIERKIRSYNPFPIAYTTLNGERIKIWAANCTSNPDNRRPGEIIAVSKQAIVVACDEGALGITQLQLPGKKAMSVAALLNADAHKQLFALGHCFV